MPVGRAWGAHLLVHAAVKTQESELRATRWHLPWCRGPRAAQQGLQEEVVVELHQLTARKEDDHLLVCFKLHRYKEEKPPHVFIR